jgi:hypothetical protein
MLAAPLSPAKLRLVCEPSRVRPIVDRLRDPLPPDDKSPSEPPAFGRKFRNDEEFPSDEPRFKLPSDRLNDSRLLRLLSPPPPMLIDERL